MFSHQVFCCPKDISYSVALLDLIRRSDDDAFAKLKDSQKSMEDARWTCVVAAPHKGKFASCAKLDSFSIVDKPNKCARSVLHLLV